MSWLKEGGGGGTRGASSLTEVSGGQDSGSGCLGGEREGGQATLILALSPLHLSQSPETANSKVCVQYNFVTCAVFNVFSVEP